MTSSYSIARHTNGTLQAAIAEKVFLPGKHRYDHARQARNLLAGQRPLAVVSAAGGVFRATDSARAQGMRIPPNGPVNGSSPLEPLDFTIAAPPGAGSSRPRVSGVAPSGR